MKGKVVGKLFKVTLAYLLAFAMTAQPIAGATVLDFSDGTALEQTESETSAETQVDETEIMPETQTEEASEIMPEAEKGDEDLFEEEIIEAETEVDADGFDIDENGVLVKYSGTAENVIIPDGVVSIKSGAFSGNSTIKKIVMPDSMQSLEHGCISSCGRLEEIVFGKNVRNAASSVITFCYGLKKITLPTFQSQDDTKGFTDQLIYPESKEANIAHVEFVIPGDSTYIPARAFGQNGASFTLEAGNTRLSIENRCIVATDNDEEGNAVKKLLRVPSVAGDLEVPDGVSVIESGAFLDTTIGGSLTLPESVTKVVAGGLAGCYIVKDFILNAKLSSLAKHAFLDDQSYATDILKGKLVLTENCANYSDSIVNEVLNGFMKGFTLYIPKEITSFNKNWADSYCKYISAEEGNEKYVTINGILYEKTGEEIDGTEEKKLVCAPGCYAPTGGLVEIPKGVTSIDSFSMYMFPFTRNAFYNIPGTTITKVVLSEDVKSIGRYAFARASSLKEVVLNSNVEFIDSQAFMYLASNFTITLPETISPNMRIASDALHSVCSLAIPASYTPSDLQKFINPDVSPLLKSVTIAEDSPYFMEKDGAILSKDGETLYYYMADSTKKYTIPEGVKTIAPYAFGNTTNANLEVTLPESLEVISANAFWGDSQKNMVIHAGSVSPTMENKALRGVASIDVDALGGSVYQYAVDNKIPYTVQHGMVSLSLKGFDADGSQCDLALSDVTINVFTKDREQVEGFVLANGMIYLPVTANLTEGTEYTISIVDESGKYKSAEKTFSLDESGNASIDEFSLEKQIYLKINHLDKNTVAALYDEDGNYIRTIEKTEDGFEDKIEEGTYQVLLFNGPTEMFENQSIEEIEDGGLNLGEDYVLIPVTVGEEDVTLKNLDVPAYVAKTNLYNPKKCTYTATYNALHDCYDMDVHLVRSQNPNVALEDSGWNELLIQIPEGYEFVTGSLSFSNSEMSEYENIWYMTDENILSIMYSQDYKVDDIYFSITKVDETIQGGVSTVKTVYGKEDVCATTFGEGMITMNVPEAIPTPYLYVNGWGNPNANVDIYVQLPGESDPVLFDSVTTSVTGYYRAYGLLDAQEGDTVSVYAVLTDEKKDETLTSETKDTIIWNATPEVDYFYINNWNHDFTVDPDTGKGPVISYYPIKTTSFVVYLENDEHVKRLFIKDKNLSIELFTGEQRTKWIGQSVDVHYEDDMDLYAELEMPDGTTKIVKLLDLYIRWIIDPSGYVYEAFPDQRIEGATVYVEDFNNGNKGRKWDAEPYEQNNPLTTGEDGTFAWDVPKGEWAIAAEKSGYDDAETEVFTVPPMRTDILIEMYPNGRYMKVTGAELSKNTMKVTFDTYVTTASVSKAGVLTLLAGEDSVPVKSVTALDERTYVNKKLSLNHKVAKEFLITFEDGVDLTKIQPEEGFTFTAESSSIAGYCNKYNRSYCRMSAVNMTGLKVSGIVDEIHVDSVFAVKEGETYVYEVEVTPASVVKGRNLTLEMKNEAVAEVVKSTILGVDGKATLIVKGNVIGETTLTIGVEGTNLTSSVDVQVVMNDDILDAVCLANAIQTPTTITPEEIEALKDPEVPEDSDSDSSTPSAAPSSTPSAVPSSKPSETPSAVPSSKPSETPSAVPSSKPSETPSAVPSSKPSVTPSTVPSTKPSVTPSTVPSTKPSVTPSATSSSEPSSTPSNAPSATPSQTPGSNTNNPNSPTVSGNEIGIKPTVSGNEIGTKPTVSGNEIGTKPTVSGNDLGQKNEQIITEAPASKKAPEKGKTYTVKSLKFKVTNAATNGTGTVTYVGSKTKSITTATIGKTIQIDGYTYKITQIADNAFKGCKKLKTVTISENVTKIGKNAFYGCKSLKTIKVKSKNLKSVGKNALKGISKQCKIKVPKTKLSKYKKLFAKKGQNKGVKVLK